MPEERVRELREAAADVHHRLRQERAKGDADALLHVRERAREAGASAEQLTRITDGFEAIAERLVDQGEARRRRPWRRRGRKLDEAELRALPTARPPRELPPGDR